MLYNAVLQNTTIYIYIYIYIYIVAVSTVCLRCQKWWWQLSL